MRHWVGITGICWSSHPHPLFGYEEENPQEPHPPTWFLGFSLFFCCCVGLVAAYPQQFTVAKQAVPEPFITSEVVYHPFQALTEPWGVH